MKRVTPFAKFPIISTKHLDEAETAITRSVTDAQIVQVADLNRFRLQMSGVKIGRSSLVFSRFGEDTKLDSRTDDLFHFIIGYIRPTTIKFHGRSIAASTQNAAIISSLDKFQITRPEHSEVLALRTSLSDLLHHFEELTARQHQGSLIFDHSADLTEGPGAILNRMMNYLVYEFHHNDLVMNTPGLLKSYDDMLLTALLSLPHSQRERLYEDRRYKVAPGLVRRAEEYMRAHLEEAISIIDLVRISGCSRSVLFSAFRNARGYTPMEFLTEQRLQCAREKLLEARQGSSVSAIALDCGFMNHGRFSRLYRKRFYELPSETLRKSR